MKLNRRNFLKMAGVTAAAWSLPQWLTSSHGDVVADPPPNFLFIVSDDQRWDALSCVQREQGAKGRFPWIRTPNMDRLAADGVRFRNMFVTCSLCSPSRACFLTGRYNHLNGVASNFRPFPTTTTTFATTLRAAGYTTAFIGKWHMDSQRERPGFDYHATYVGHGQYLDPTFIVNGKELPRQGWIDDIATDYTIDFLRNQNTSRKPWAMILALKSPHESWVPPARSVPCYTDEKARAVPNLTSPPSYSARVRDRLAMTGRSGPDASAKLDYFRCISAADDCLGRILDALDELKLAENTVVIYTSDNGYYLGEHGLGDKRSAYDESLRIPLIVRYPKLAAKERIVDEMVLNVDLAPTLLDLAGLPADPAMQGLSWRPLLAGQPVEWRKSWFYEYFAEAQNNVDVPDITAVRTDTAKLIKYPGHDEWTELFDLVADPYETHNLIGDKAHQALRTALEAEHDRLVKKLGFRVPDYVDRPNWWAQ